MWFSSVAKFIYVNITIFQVKKYVDENAKPYICMLTVFCLQIEVSQKVIAGLYKGVTTVELDNLAAETAADMMTKHPDYAILAARIAVSNLHKKIEKVFLDYSLFMYCGLLLGLNFKKVKFY